MSTSPVLLNDRGNKTPDPAPSFVADLVRAVFPRKPEKSGFTLLLTAPDRSSGVSFAAASIVAELAPTGARILLADAQALNAFPTPIAALNACERLGPGRVHVLGRQQIPPTDSETASPLAVLEALQQDFTYIVLDAPALDASTLPLLLATTADGAVLVARAGHTEAKAIAAARHRLLSLGAHVFGSIYNAR